MSQLIPLPPSLEPFLALYLPRNGVPFVTLTYAQSLDAKIAAGPGLQTVISHLETKTMTHYLRSKHDAILVGLGTVLSDDPGLNCRYNAHRIRPVVVDPRRQWVYQGSRIDCTVASGDGLAPFIIIDAATEVPKAADAYLEAAGGRYVRLERAGGQFDWRRLLDALAEYGIGSVMVEGGAKVINSLLVYQSEGKGVVDSLIVTVGPVYLGDQGVGVSPMKNVWPSSVTWWSGVQDSVMCAKLE
ncbi:hypothetical protein BABINDRAFT_46257 [Babjeviella inositovora NRRL Y-12698]|uniref:2,5-diamino-6-ribosylamino-4(3H)-pyrimidinone 5'-phosphate reductase n=1 Tax=Babjeviella inositovora NRRL Y-12698 TaxID=984486 RepID=A0A1E3QY95_9ASCO|nr:uncharacterized protein BABINDRAFT_46257 [Babjeviella inositovora NRRL Y-12698]ODQ82082.1 hypothetical protein BABINDRAFT_46257 [Babjeviella inositovora NRRL Y-12698]